jgi:CRISPR-associated endonuclease/helicase Cas3
MFCAATGRDPGEWLVRAAADGLPELLEVPGDSAPAEAILAWLWRLRLPDNSKRRRARRLVYVLPEGTVVEPAVAGVRGWLERLGLSDEVGLHVSMGIWASSCGPDWREDAHQPAVLIGTAEFLASKALMRGLGAGPGMWPIDFALVTNGAHWVMHDGQASARATATLRQLLEIAGRRGTAEPLGLTVLSPGDERVLPVPRLRGVERATLATRPGERLAVTQPAAAVPAAPAVLGLEELQVLFDTSSGSGEDAGPLCREGAAEAGVTWATWSAGEDGAPDPEVRLPPGEWRCAVPLSSIEELARDRAVWRRGAEGAWERVDPAFPQVRPYQVLLVSAADGGYDPVAGFDPARRDPVPGCPVLLTPAEMELLAADGPAGEAPAPRPWQTLDSHSEEVRDQAVALLEVLAPEVPAAAGTSAVVAGYLHDVGKAHVIWQDALCALAPGDDQEMVQAGRPWAKSGNGAHGRLEFAAGVSFLHELASLLLIDAPLRNLLGAAPDTDLCRYLVLAHHGRLRTRVREPSDDAAEPRVIYGLAHGAASAIPPVLGQPPATLAVDLDQFGDGSDRSSWGKAVAGLLERYGPFVLAYLETVVRIADWRASGGRDRPADPEPPRPR